MSAKRTTNSGGATKPTWRNSGFGSTRTQRHNMDSTNSLKKTARLAALLWLLGAATAGFSLVYVRPQVIVPGDAAATVSNILAFEPLFRAGIASMILSQIFLLFFGLAIFRIFQSVNRTLSTVCLMSLVVGGGIGIVNQLNNLGAVTLVTNPDYVRAFQPSSSILWRVSFSV